MVGDGGPRCVAGGVWGELGSGGGWCSGRMGGVWGGVGDRGSSGLGRGGVSPNHLIKCWHTQK